MKIRDEIGKALQASGVTYIGDNHDIVVYLLCEERSLLGAIREVEIATKEVLDSDRNLYEVRSIGNNKRHQKVQSNRLGNDVMELLMLDSREFSRLFPLCEFNPYLKLFFDHSDRVDWLELLRMHLDSRHLMPNETLKLVTGLNKFVAAIRSEARAEQFKKRISNFERSAKKNTKSLEGYIDALFETYSKLNVLRLDLAYMGEYGVKGGGKEVTYDEARRHREVFIRTLSGYLSKTLAKECMVGFAWKLEYGLRKSWHYHVMIFLNGQVTRNDIGIAKLIGEYWSSVAEGKGLYYNCNAYKTQYKSCGIGLIDYRNTKMRQGLGKAVVYMTKTDYYVKVQTPDKGRTFGRGVAPKRKLRGRPRATAGKGIKCRHLHLSDLNTRHS